MALSHRNALALGSLSLLVLSLAGACSDDPEEGSNGEAGAAGSGSSSGGSGSVNEAGSSSVVPGDAGAGGTALGSSGAPSASGAGGNEPGYAGESAGGTDGAGGSGGEASGLYSATPQDLANESAADYADNGYGVIVGSKLKGWVEGWQQNRPAGVTGKLVVLQVVPNAANSLAHVATGAGVVSYLLPQSELLQVRDTGLSQIEAEIPGGQAADALLKKYGIDVVNDYVVLTFEQLPATDTAPATANSIVQSVGRAWLLLRYWGFPKERLGILNGSVNWNAANQALPIVTTPAATPPNDGTTTVKDLPVDNTQLVVPLSELLAILKNKHQSLPRDQVTVVDARGGAEALGLAKSTSTGKTDCPSYTGTAPNNRCSPPFEGRIKGAQSVPWPQFLGSADDGFRFPPKATLKQTFDTLSGYQEGNVTIQYCRTNMRSAVTGVVAAVILGYPTRFYDTSFIEWSHLAYGTTTKTRVLPPDSPFRTDFRTLTEHAVVTNYTPGVAYDSATMTITGWIDGPNYNADDDISPTPIQIVPTATSTDASVLADRLYKLE